MSAPSNAVQVQGQGVATADQLNTFVQGCATAAQLRTFIGLSGMSVYLAGINSPEDGNGGLFQWFPSSNAPDNNYTVIVPNGVSQGAWIKDPAAPAMWAGAFTMNPVGGLVTNFKIPITPLSQGKTGAFDFFQAPLFVMVQYCPQADTSDYTCAGLYWVQLTYRNSAGGSVGIGPYAYAIPIFTIMGMSGAISPPTAITYGFNPNVGGGISFAIASSSGVLYDQLSVTITSGSNIGANSANMIGQAVAARGVAPFAQWNSAKISMQL